MFESRHRSSGGSSANRWLVVAGGGLVILAFVARMLLDIGHTRVSDLAGALHRDTSGAAAAVPAPAPAPPVMETPAPVEPPAAPAPDTAPRVPATTSGSAPKVSAATSDTAPKVPVVASPPPVLKNDTTSPPAANSISPGGNRFVIQIGAFGSEANAGALGKRASALGYEAAVIPQVRGASTLYLVRVTGTGTAAQARQASDSLARSLGVTAVVLRPGR